MQAGLLAPALPIIRDSVGTLPSATFLVRVMLVAPTVAIILCAPIIGAWADRIKRTDLLTAGLGIYALCGLAAFFAHSIEQLIFVRLALGVAVAAISTMTALLVGAYFEGKERDRILGWQAALIGVGGAFFPVAGGLLAEFEWRFVFLPYLFAALLILPVLRLPKPSRPSVSPPGGEVFPYGSVLLIYSLAFLGTLVLYLLPMQMAFHLHDMGNMAPSAAGLALAVASLAAAATSMLYSRLRERLSFASLAALSFLLMAVGYAMIAFARSGTVVAVGLVVAGSGFGINLPNCTAWLLSRVSPRTRGQASGGLSTAMFLGQLVSAFLYEALVSRQGSARTFLITAAASVIACLALAVHSLRENSERLRAAGVAGGPSGRGRGTPESG